MHIPRTPRDRIEVDWARDKLYIAARDTGEAVPVYLFVGILPFSMYAYAEVCLRMDMRAIADSYRQRTEDPTVANLSFDERCGAHLSAQRQLDRI